MSNLTIKMTQTSIEIQIPSVKTLFANFLSLSLLGFKTIWIRTVFKLVPNPVELFYDSSGLFSGPVTYLLMLNIKGEVKLYVCRKLYVIPVSCYFNTRHPKVHVCCK